MPVTFRLLPHRNLALFTYSGEVTLQESMDVVAAAAAAPGYSPHMRQLCDLAAVTGVERDYAKLLKMQARILEDLLTQDMGTIVVFHAPTDAGRCMAEMARRSWDGLDTVVVLVQETEAGALSILGLPEQRIGDLLVQA